MSDSVDVAVIGLGAMGAATAYQLARRGAAVLGIDRFDPPHSFGSSHGDSRITRCAIGEGPAYTPLALRARVLWQTLEVETGARLMETRGCLVLAPDGGEGRGADFLATTIATAERHDIPHEVLDAAALATRFPHLDRIEGHRACFEPGAGALHPEACVEAQLRMSVHHGARLSRGVTVKALESTGGGVTLTLDGGETVRAAQAVVAAGPWAGRLLGAPFDRLLTPQRQVQHWFALDDDAPSSWRSSPVMIRAHGDGAHFAYAVPDLSGAAIVKMGSHNDTPAADPMAGLDPVTPEEAAAFHQAFVADYAIGVTPRQLRASPCFYTMTPDGHFIVDDHPALPGVTVLAACSGHGFKYSAALGEAVAEKLALGAPAHTDLSPFALSRFG